MARKNTKKDFKTVLSDILEQENKMYDEANIVRTFAIAFPNRQKTPLLGKIGAKLITMAGGIIQINFHQMIKK